MADDNEDQESDRLQFGDDPLSSSSGSETMKGRNTDGDGSLPNSPSTDLPNSPRQPFVPASPPKFVSFEQLMSAANGVKNMTLAHEIAVNTDFKLEYIDLGEKSRLYKEVKQVVHKAFWDSFKEKLDEDPPDYSGILVLLAEIKENLFHLLLPQHERLRSHITEVLDMDLIEQKVNNDALDVQYYSDFIISIMARLCAPVRDGPVAQLRELSGIIPLFRQMFAVLDSMKMDMANFTIQQMRPYVQQHSVEYERKKFQELVTVHEEMGVDGVEFTRNWLSRNYNKLTAVHSATPAKSATSTTGANTASSVTPGTVGAGATPAKSVTTVGAGAGSSSVTPADVLNTAYLELLEWDDDIQAYPETLLMDQERFSKLRDLTRHITLISTLLLVTYNTAGESIAGISGFKNQLKSDLSVLLDGVAQSDLANKLVHVADHVIIQINETLTKHDYNALSDVQTETMKQQYPLCLSTHHPVHRIIRSRVFDFIRELLLHGCRSPAKIPSGLSAMEKEVAQLSGQFLRLVTHNRSVFGLFYGDIIGTLLRT